MVDGLATGLLANGIKKGDRLAIISKNCIEYFALYGAAARIGSIVVPVNWRLSRSEIQYILSDTTPKLVFADLEFRNLIREILSDFHFVKRFYSTSGSGERLPFLSFDELGGDPELQDKISVLSDDPFVIMHTAAVGGKPRGAILTYRNLISASMDYIVALSLNEKDVHLAFLPLFHIACLGMAMAVLHAGGKNIIMPKFDTQIALKYIEQEKVTLILDFPPVLSNLLEEAKESPRRLSSIRRVVGIDRPETINELEKMTKSRFVVAYGQTELSGVASLGCFYERPGSAGRPGLLTNIRLVDDFDNQVSAGETGEVTVRGPSVFNGYWKLKKETEYTFRNGWHHTGDLARFDEGGYLWYVGRKPEKELIKPGGENVYPAEVEAIILEHPAIKEVCVIGVQDPDWKEAIKAVCVLKPDESLAAEDLIQFVGSKISKYKRPRYVEITAEFPRLSDGSIDREKIKRNFGT